MCEWISKWGWLLKLWVWIRKRFMRRDHDMSEEGRIEMARIRAKKWVIFFRNPYVGMALLIIAAACFYFITHLADHRYSPAVEQQNALTDDSGDAK